MIDEILRVTLKIIYLLVVMQMATQRNCRVRHVRRVVSKPLNPFSEQRNMSSPC